MENKEIRLINLRKLLSEVKTAAALAYAANTSPSYISQILSQKTRGSIGNKLARRLEVATGKPKGWLDTLHDREDELASFFSIKNIPFVELDKILEWCEGNKSMIKKIRDSATENLTNGSDDKNIFQIEMVGDSMMSPFDIPSSICPGDIVVIDQTIKPIFGDIVLVKIRQSIKIRQLLKDGDETILKALNHQYPIISMSSQIKMIGVVIEIRRKLLPGINRTTVN